jgi:hypothetical protein
MKKRTSYLGQKSKGISRRNSTEIKDHCEKSRGTPTEQIACFINKEFKNG